MLTFCSTPRLMIYSYLFIGTLESLAAFYNYFTYMAERGPLHELRPFGVTSTLPAEVDDDQLYLRDIALPYPLGYTPYQLLGAWNWVAGSGMMSLVMCAALCVPIFASCVYILLAFWY